MSISLEQAIAIRRDLLEQGGSYRGSAKRLMHVGTKALHISEEEFAEIEKRGQQIFDLEQRVNGLYAEKSSKDSGHYLVQQVENGFDEITRKAQRIIAQERPLSLFKRTDESRPGFIVEVQKRCGGLCFWTKWHRAFEKYSPLEHDEVSISKINGFVEPMKWMMGTGTDSSDVLVLITPLKDFLSQCHFANLIHEETGIIAIPVPKEIAAHCIEGTRLLISDELLGYLHQHEYKLPFNPGAFPKLDVGMFYRRELSLADFVKFKGWDEIFQSYLSGKLIIQPELNLLEDTKLSLGLPFHPSLQENIAADLLKVFPVAAIMPDSWEENFQFGTESFSLSQIRDMKRNDRAFVIKYSGTNMEYGLGGRGVYRIHNISQRQAEKDIQYALGQIQEAHPWVIQKLDKTHHMMSYLDKTEDIEHSDAQMHARYCFYYYRFDDGVRFVHGEAALRRHWKATGADDAVVAPVRIKKNTKVRYHPQKNNAQLRMVD